MLLKEHSRPRAGKPVVLFPLTCSRPAVTDCAHDWRYEFNRGSSNPHPNATAKSMPAFQCVVAHAGVQHKVLAAGRDVQRVELRVFDGAHGLLGTGGTGPASPWPRAYSVFITSASSAAPRNPRTSSTPARLAFRSLREALTRTTPPCITSSTPTRLGAATMWPSGHPPRGVPSLG